MPIIMNEKILQIVPQLVKAISNIYQMEWTQNIYDKVAFYTMMLSDKLYEKLFQKLSQELNVEITILHKIFVEQIVMKQLVNYTSQDNIEQSEMKFKPVYLRKPSQSAQEIQNRFVAALKQVLGEQGCDVPPFVNNCQLCIMVNDLKYYRPQEFWKKIRILIPEKTEIQLREYYQKSFLRHMYEENISVQDRATLCDLINQMPGAKPSQIANEFVKIVGENKYFHRNVIMYVVNKYNK
ncbi:Hypothetical_protein [Hexamita inflata]|uniref:Hypothetical_protein n=1 Tax=Hexamita inflata TaxID=28002 RepID=A0AA86NKJ8_9EUKA|nr:Hypothetical protein HINF_LOCUS8301 [Hexamita inflata]